MHYIFNALLTNYTFYIILDIRELLIISASSMILNK